MKAKEYLEVYLGGNMFVKKLTPHAITEFAEDYHKMKMREQKTKFNNLEDCVKWARANTPFAIRPLRKAKTMLIYPFKSINAFDVVTRRIAEELYKELQNENLSHKEFKK